MKWSAFTQYVRLAYEGMMHRKKRAWLTVIGIFIGIMAVVALVSLGQGLEAGVNAEFEKLGGDKLFVQPAGAFGGTGANAPNPIREKDLRAVRSVLGVKEALGSSYRTARVDWGDEVGFYYVAASPSDPDEQRLFDQAFQINIDHGRPLEKSDGFKAIIGIDYTDRAVFKETMDVGSSFTINGGKFTVVGVRKRVGNDADDRQIVIPADAFEEVLPMNDTFSMIIARAQPGIDTEVLADNIRRKLQQERDVEPGDEDFSVQTAEDIRKSFDSVLSIIQVVLGGIAFISLIVGAVGIMNTMYTAVLERTKEIGIMKAVGATNNAVLTIFLIESGMLGLLGGLIGVILGLGISYGTSQAAAQFLGNNIIQAYVSWWLVLGGLGFSFVVGALAGFFPARQAAKMKPVDSLRYE